MSALQKEILLSTLEETHSLGRRLGRLAIAGDVICLDGDLGAGKTALTQAIAKGLEVPDSCYVTSPSFAMLHEYPGRMPLYHMDFYRLSGSEEILDLGFDEYFYLSGLTVIEWSERAPDILPDDRLTLRFRMEQGCRRRITIRFGKRWRERMALL